MEIQVFFLLLLKNKILVRINTYNVITCSYEMWGNWRSLQKGSQTSKYNNVHVFLK